MSFLGFEQSGFVLDLRLYVRAYARAEGRAMQYEVAEVEIYVYRAYGASGPRSYDPDINRISNTDSSFGDGWGVNVQHHNTTTAAALGRHVMFCSDAHLAAGNYRIFQRCRILRLRRPVAGQRSIAVTLRS